MKNSPTSLMPDNMEMHLYELEALADLLIDKATKLKLIAIKARQKAAGVSTSANPKGIDPKTVAMVIAKRHLRRKKLTTTKP